MPLVTLTNLLSSELSLQADTRSVTLLPNGTLALSLSTAALEDLEPVLDDATAQGWLTWLVAADPAQSLATLTAPNGDSVPLVPGMPAATIGGQLLRARSGSQAHAYVVGIVIVGAGLTLPTRVQCAGAIALPELAWDAVVEASLGGGLVPSAKYYVSALPGMITTTPPTIHGDYIASVGRAVTPTLMSVGISASTQL